MKWNAILFAILFALVTPAARAQNAPKAGFPLNTSVSVSGNVSVETILLPPSVTRGVFGKAVADRYVAVQLIVSNRSQDAALVVQSIYLDYSQWLGSGAATALQAKDWQASSAANQIAAAEYRVPRGQLLDAQQWSARNLTIRGLETIGGIAAGYVFAFHEVGIARGVAAYNGNFLPAMRALIPDSAIDQANRISDLGFRVNKVIAPQSSDIMVAFFPMDRLLTPGMKKLFEKSPAIFFVPQAAALDRKTAAMLKSAIPPSASDLGSQLLLALESGTPNASSQLLDSLSFNRIRVVVGGAMTVNVDTLPASIESVDFDETDAAALWAEAGVKKGTIHGNYLSGGSVVLPDASKLGFSGMALIQDGSSDQALRFQFSTGAPVSPKTVIGFQVNKTGKDQKPVTGATFNYTVPDYLLTAPSVTKVDVSGKTLTITGAGFYTTGADPLTVTLEPSAVAGAEPVPVKSVTRQPTSLSIDLAQLSLTPACWTPRVAVGAMTAPSASAFPQPPAPKILSAALNGTRIVLTGEQFIDLKTCGKPLSFEIAGQAAGSAFQAVSNLTIVSAKEVSFDDPKLLSGPLKVRVLVGGVEADTRNVQ